MELWRGESGSRQAGEYRAPTAEDWNKLVGVIQEIQKNMSPRLSLESEPEFKHILEQIKNESRRNLDQETKLKDLQSIHNSLSDQLKVMEQRIKEQNDQYELKSNKLTSLINETLYSLETVSKTKVSEQDKKLSEFASRVLENQRLTNEKIDNLFKSLNSNKTESIETDNKLSLRVTENERKFDDMNDKLKQITSNVITLLGKVP